MGQSDAAIFGSVGERRVAEMLTCDAASFGYTVLSGLLLDAGERTAHFDHLLIDRYGILVVEVLGIEGDIRGRSADRTWSSLTRSGRRDSFPNPLIENDRRREALHRVLVASGRNLAPEYVQSLVVLTVSDLSGLRLGQVDSMRVIQAREVTDFVRARYDFEPNLGTLDAEQISGLISLLKSVDRASDPEVIARHADSSRDGLLRRLLGPRRADRSPAPGSRTVFGPHDRYPDGTHRVPIKSGPSATSQILMLLVVGLLAWFIFFGGGPEIVAVQVSRLMSGNAMGDENPIPQAEPAALDPTFALSYDVPLALRRMQEADPGIYSALRNPGSPQLSASNGLPTYIWEYARGNGVGAGGVRTISLTLDQAGNVVGVTGSHQ